MKKLLVIICSALLLAMSFQIFTYADTPKSKYEQLGFKEGMGAVNQFEQANGIKLELPTKKPPITFTHVYSRFKNNQGLINDSVEIIYKNGRETKQHYVIRVGHKGASLPIAVNKSTNEIKLNDGSNAYYFNEKIDGYHLFVFTHGDFQYVIGINKEISNIVTESELKEIAESL